jgi:HAD superfamily hydrolase (TIGR01484 family)
MMNERRPDAGIVVTDLDGTLLNHRRVVSEPDLRTLRGLRAAGVVRAIATGRSPYSFRRVLDTSLPVDYLLFSSGAGIMDWQRQHWIQTWRLNAAEVGRISAIFEEEEVNYMIHDPIPENHRFVYRELRSEDTDFRRRCEIYERHCAPLPGPPFAFRPACQVIGILPPDLERFHRLRARLSEFSVVRATSPLDGHNLWMEIFPRGVSKSSGSKWLIAHLGITPERTFALGNDYNDLDLLDWAAHSAVTANAPVELRERFAITASHREHALTAAVQSWGLLGDADTASASG